MKDDRVAFLTWRRIKSADLLSKVSAARAAAAHLSSSYRDAHPRRTSSGCFNGTDSECDSADHHDGGDDGASHGASGGVGDRAAGSEDSTSNGSDSESPGSRQSESPDSDFRSYRRRRRRSAATTSGESAKLEIAASGNRLGLQVGPGLGVPAVGAVGPGPEAILGTLAPSGFALPAVVVRRSSLKGASALRLSTSQTKSTRKVAIDPSLGPDPEPSKSVAASNTAVVAAVGSQSRRNWQDGPGSDSESRKSPSRNKQVLPGNAIVQVVVPFQLRVNC